MEKRPTQGWSNCLADIVWSISKLDIQAWPGARLIHRNTKEISKLYIQAGHRNTTPGLF